MGKTEKFKAIGVLEQRIRDLDVRIETYTKLIAVIDDIKSLGRYYSESERESISKNFQTQIDRDNEFKQNLISALSNALEGE